MSASVSTASLEENKPLVAVVPSAVRHPTRSATAPMTAYYGSAVEDCSTIPSDEDEEVYDPNDKTSGYSDGSSVVSGRSVSQVSARLRSAPATAHVPRQYRSKRQSAKKKATSGDVRNVSVVMSSQSSTASPSPSCYVSTVGTAMSSSVSVVEGRLYLFKVVDTASGTLHRVRCVPGVEELIRAVAMALNLDPGQVGSVSDKEATTVLEITYTDSDGDLMVVSTDEDVVHVIEDTMFPNGLSPSSGASMSSSNTPKLQVKVLYQSSTVKSAKRRLQSTLGSLRKVVTDGANSLSKHCTTAASTVGTFGDVISGNIVSVRSRAAVFSPWSIFSSFESIFNQMLVTSDTFGRRMICQGRSMAEQVLAKANAGIEASSAVLVTTGAMALSSAQKQVDSSVNNSVNLFGEMFSEKYWGSLLTSCSDSLMKTCYSNASYLMAGGPKSK